jgi:hypothetical protein
VSIERRMMDLRKCNSIVTIAWPIVSSESISTLPDPYEAWWSFSFGAAALRTAAMKMVAAGDYGAAAKMPVR